MASASRPLAGRRTYSRSRSTPQPASRATSSSPGTSTQALKPSAAATVVAATVSRPEVGRPTSSVMRPRGKPPSPVAASSAGKPLETAGRRATPPGPTCTTRPAKRALTASATARGEAGARRGSSGSSSNARCGTPITLTVVLRFR